jgi:small-conductance mechanosensitive channel
MENVSFQALLGDARTLLFSSAILALSALVGTLVYILLYKFISRVTLRSTSTLQLLLAKQTRPPARYILPLLALTIALPLTPLPESFRTSFEHFITICLISAFGWLLTTLVQVVSTLITTRHSVTVADNLYARRIETQTQVLKRIVIICIVVVTVGVVLMTFPSARQIGASVFASAGIAGVIVGVAARSTFSSLIAGLQIAITQPIRIDDAVVVEGEWGWIEEIESTYVVIRLWDLRRLLVPLSYFIEKPFQNWTRSTAEIIGTVFIYVDYKLPVDPVRAELQRILQNSEQWNRKTCALQITDFTETTMQLRCLMSANSSSLAFDLRCHVR